MKPRPRIEKRRYARQSVTGRLTGHILPSLSSRDETEQTFEAAIHDISEGGLCIVVPWGPPVSSPIRCEIRLAELPIAIPTLTQVRWVKTNPSAPGARVGLQFLL